MAQESCNLDKDEAEILKPSPSPSPSSSPSPSPAPPSPTSPPSSLILKPPQGSPAQRPERPEASAAKAAAAATLKPEEGSQAPARFGNRCSSCRKRVGLTGFRCRCGDLFCVRHRYSDTHDCSFDYKAAGREEISKANPLIRAAKIIKI